MELLRANAYLADYRIFQCPSVNTTIPPGYNGPLKEEYIDYVYRGGLTENDSPDSALIWDKPGNHENFGFILFLSGKVKGFAGKDWVKNAK